MGGATGHAVLLVQEPFHRRLAFDLGDVGIGQLTNSLELGCDCLGSIHYFDAVLNNSKGEGGRHAAARDVPWSEC